jgi:hypothetical protein
MSQQGAQKAQQLLNALGQQFPAIVQASETEGVHLGNFTHGLLARLGLPANDAGPNGNGKTAAFVNAFVDLMQS